MTVTRSPAYPGMALGQAIDLIAKVYSENRTNPVDREAAAKDMGFAGMTGSSSKALADLAHYGLIEKAGKGTIRVTQRAVDILYPASPSGKMSAISDAASGPALFSDLRAQFHDGVPSENNLRSYLMRTGFASSAIPLVLNSYRDTCRLLQESSVSESSGSAPPPQAESTAAQQAPEIKMPATSNMPSPSPAMANPTIIREALAALELNKINMNISANTVQLSALLDFRGLTLLEKKIANLKALMAPDDDESE